MGAEAVTPKVQQARMELYDFLSVWTGRSICNIEFEITGDTLRVRAEFVRTVSQL